VVSKVNLRGIPALVCRSGLKIVIFAEPSPSEREYFPLGLLSASEVLG